VPTSAQLRAIMPCMDAVCRTLMLFVVLLFSCRADIRSKNTERPPPFIIMSSLIFQPLRDIFADATVEDNTSEDPMDVDSPAQTSFPFGEVGGIFFAGDEKHAQRYQDVGGAIYRPFLPFGTVTAAVTDDRVARRIAASKGKRRSSDPLWMSATRSLLSLSVFPLCPIIRTIVPRSLLDIAGTTTLVDDRTRDVHTCRDIVVAMAFHRHLPVLAVATRDASRLHRVYLYDVAQEERMPLFLSHDFQNRGIHALAWKPYARDCLVAGCEGGILCWSLSAGAAANTSTRVAASAANMSHPYGPLWGGITDETPMAVWYECSPGAPVSTVVFSSDGRYAACASEHSVSLHLHDLSSKPRDALIVESVAVEGGTCSVCFSPDDGFLLRAIRHRRYIKLLSTATFRNETIVVDRPVTKIVALDAAACGTSNATHGGAVFALQFDQTEGVALVRFHNMDPTATSPNSKAVMIVCALVSTGVVSRGVGGAVTEMVMDGKRLFLRVGSGHVLVLGVACAEGHPWSVRGVGLIPPSSSPSPACCMTASPSFYKGSLLATTHGPDIRFFPSYYSR
jgi:hypothetical protein